MPLEPENRQTEIKASVEWKMTGFVRQPAAASDIDIGSCETHNVFRPDIGLIGRE